ncbi:MAG TPA: hypothetical protein VF159_00495 [Gemmatimonadaceae bacterium]
MTHTSDDGRAHIASIADDDADTALIVSYLMNELSLAERRAFEERVKADPAFAEHAEEFKLLFAIPDVVGDSKADREWLESFDELLGDDQPVRVAKPKRMPEWAWARAAGIAGIAVLGAGGSYTLGRVAQRRDEDARRFAAAQPARELTATQGPTSKQPPAALRMEVAKATTDPRFAASVRAAHDSARTTAPFDPIAGLVVGPAVMAEANPQHESAEAKSPVAACDSVDRYAVARQQAAEQAAEKKRDSVAKSGSGALRNFVAAILGRNGAAVAVANRVGRLGPGTSPALPSTASDSAPVQATQPPAPATAPAGGAKACRTPGGAAKAP